MLDRGAIGAENSFQGSEGADWPGDGWWYKFEDAQLVALIDQGLADLPDMAAAAARLRQVDAAAQAAGAPLLPTLDAQGGVSLDRQSLNTGFPDEFRQFLPQGWKKSGRAAGALGFDIDIWGRNRAALAAATSEARAAVIDLGEARLMLSTSIALAYFDLARLFDERDVHLTELEIRSATGKLVSRRMNDGLETTGSLQQA